MGGQDGHKGETLAPDSDFKEFLPNRSFFFLEQKCISSSSRRKEDDRGGRGG